MRHLPPAILANLRDFAHRDPALRDATPLVERAFVAAIALGLATADAKAWALRAAPADETAFTDAISALKVATERHNADVDAMLQTRDRGSDAVLDMSPSALLRRIEALALRVEALEAARIVVLASATHDTRP